jgi:hypothetical protein
MEETLPFSSLKVASTLLLWNFAPLSNLLESYKMSLVSTCVNGRRIPLEDEFLSSLECMRSFSYHHITIRVFFFSGDNISSLCDRKEKWWGCDLCKGFFWEKWLKVTIFSREKTS